MSHLSHLEFDELSDDDQMQVDQLCDAFEAEVRSGNDVTIEHFLRRIQKQAARRTALKELIGLELFHTRSDRTDLTFDDYKNRFPDDHDCVHAAFEEAATLFSPGTVLGAFRIDRRLGEGGMGVVYAAHDQTLKRNVALKFLPFALARDKKRLAQFQREARILAGLTHPHIATLYGFERLAGLHLCVMEHVPGSTLNDVLNNSGRLPLDDAVRVFKQFAAALEYAHSSGVVHRDLKPPNVVITPSGELKLLDFGLALNVPNSVVAEDQKVDSGTATQMAAIAGTVAYMSPEQLRGRQVDKRSDIWAFGCCLYEALSGRKAFGGETTSDLVAAIMNDEPDWTAIPQDTPRSIRFVLQRCLEKDPDRRLRDIGDAWLDDDYLDSVLVTDANTHDRPSILPRSTSKWVTACLGGILMAALAFFTLPTTKQETPTAATATRWWTLSLPATHPVALADRAQLSEGRPSIVLTPDGSRLVYVATVDGVPMLCVRHLNRQDNVNRAEVLSGTEGAFNPFISPNGEWVGFLTDKALKKVSLNGGEPIMLCSVNHAYGATWGPNGDVYFSEKLGARLSRVSDQGGTKELVSYRPLANSYIWPEALPNGKGVLVYQEGRGILCVTKAGEELLLHEHGMHARYVSSGHIVYSQPGRLWAMPFDLDRLTVTGDSVPVVDHLRTESRGAAQFSAAHDGSMVFVPGGHAALGELVKVPVQPVQSVVREEESLGFLPDVYGTFELSPDGRRLAIVVWGEKRNIWVFDLVRKTRVQLTFEGDNRTPLWTPNGESIVFSSDRHGSMNLYRVSANRRGEVERLTTSSDHHFSSHWFVEGGRTWLAISTRIGPVNRMLSLSPREERSLPKTHFASQLVTISPNGRWIAHGGDQVWIQKFPGPGPRERVSTDGGEEAIFAPNGNFVYYRNGRQWMAVAVQTEPTLSLGEPQCLFEGDYLNVRDRSYDITPDGKYFIVLRAAAPSAPTRLAAVSHWFDDLKRLAPKAAD